MRSVCKVETAAVGAGWSARLGPGSVVSLAAEIPGAGGLTYGDVFNPDHFDAEPEPEKFVPPTDEDKE